VQDFNFNQAPRAPVLLATNPPTDSPTIPAYFVTHPACLGCTAVLNGLPGTAGPRLAQSAVVDRKRDRRR